MQLKNIIGLTGIIIVIVVLIIICIGIFIWLKLSRRDPKSYTQMSSKKYVNIDPLYYEAVLLKQSLMFIPEYIKLYNGEYDQLLENSNFTDNGIKQEITRFEKHIDEKSKKFNGTEVDINMFKIYLDDYCKCMAPLITRMGEKNGNIPMSISRACDLNSNNILVELYEVMGKDEGDSFFEEWKYKIPDDVINMNGMEAVNKLVEANINDRLSVKSI